MTPWSDVAVARFMGRIIRRGARTDGRIIDERRFRLQARSASRVSCCSESSRQADWKPRSPAERFLKGILRRCVQPFDGKAQIGRRDDVVAAKYRVGLVPHECHGDDLRHTSKNQVPHGRSAEIVRNASRTTGRSTGDFPSLCRAHDPLRFLVPATFLRYHPPEHIRADVTSLLQRLVIDVLCLQHCV